MLTATEALHMKTLPLLRGEPVFGAGSLPAAEANGLPYGWSDADFFVPSEQILISTVRMLLERGCVMDDRFSRVWYRWLRYGMKGWHTNSMRLETLDGIELNIVYKKVDGHPTTSLSQVLESFDFGLLAVGWDMETGQFRDLRPYLFPGYDIDGPLPLMPNKRDNWVNGFISQYNGLREGGRYAKYRQYGYDLSLVAQDLVAGWRQAASYHCTSFKEDKQTLAEIYVKLADLVEADAVDELVETYKILDYDDELSVILEKLE